MGGEGRFCTRVPVVCCLALGGQLCPDWVRGPDGLEKGASEKWFFTGPRGNFRYLKLVPFLEPILENNKVIHNVP